MAINTPLSDARLNSLDYSSPQVLEAQRAANQAAQAGYQQGAQGIQDERNENLKAMLQGKTLKNQKAMLDTMKDENPNSQVKVGELSVGVDPSLAMQKNMMNKTAGAMKDVNNAYSQGSKPLEDKLDAATGLLGALKQNDATTLGQSRSFMLKAMGLNRFNEAEGQAVSPQSYRSMIESALSKVGLPVEGQGTLTDQQRSSITKFANTALDEAQDRHNAVKSQALQQYENSPFFEPEKFKQISNTIGGPIDQRISKLKAGYDELHTNAIPSTQPQATSQPNQSILGQLRNGLSSLLGSPSKSSNAAPPQQAPAQGSAQPLSPPGFDVDAYLGGK